ncbi:alpha/beta hydrolase fold domain-containing protein [Thermogutta sp.]|uniref:alpha/beta hydrolase fold domain-containing protein n=1 Tax=Thermogutta sp. TaxID=1962930 RepID=UPI003C7BAF57
MRRIRKIFPALVWLAWGVFAAVAVGEPSPADFISRFDRDKDGKLTREEAPPPIAQNFARIDSNNDGLVDPDEIAAFRQRVVQAARVQNQPGQPPRVPDSIDAIWDIPYAQTDHPRQRLDLLLPKKRASDKPLPVVVAIHGGAWMGGDKRQVVGWLIPFVASGQYAGVSVGYRLSQDATWPAQIYDCKAALRWIRGNAKKYNLDREKIGVIGWSAGGHLVAMLGTSGGVKELEGDLGEFTSESSGVACVVDFFGPTDFLTIGDHPSQIKHNAPDSPEARLIGGAIPDNPDKARQASPITFVSEDDPPFLLVHGTKDPLVPHQQSVILRDALRKAGVPAYLITVEDGGHGGFKNPEIERIVHAFFDAHLRGVQHDFEDKTLPNTP